MSTFLELAQQLRQELGVSGTGPTTVVSQVGTLKKVCDCIIEADYMIAILWADWNFLWKQWTPSATVSATYSAPSGLGKYDKESFYFSIDDTCLTYVPYKKWRESYRDSDTGTPDMFTIKPDNSVVLEPPPDTVGSLTADY